ncbi:hypothetical protein L249_1775 [Ophiocordyceps polyrhachis-furcata BCC 54312]|uniref:Uncharacterized protein n=1 Tax=Ophiocordyceps polyrhachis-furcata BCC 54312 TaxID=1330021 RepID=A0A367LR83_9HYPO|nr:hypothetical protein L249_1775 [Ophiocordyceps polyrhachis-furcata BCC 54312]
MASEKHSNTAGDTKQQQPGSEEPSSSKQPPNPPAYEEAVPTLSNPFQFPSNANGLLPAYDDAALGGDGSSSCSSFSPIADARPIAIPQLCPGSTAPFLSAYAPALLRHGVTVASWRSFVDTVSAFLTARVSDRAVNYAADVARQVSQGPKTFGKGVASHARAVSRDIVRNAKRGSVIGTTLAVLEGVIAIPVSTAIGAAGAALRLPGSAMDAVITAPQTPLQRANAYAAVANRDWLHARGLQAVLVTTIGLAAVLETTVAELLTRTGPVKGEDAAAQLRALEPLTAPLEVDEKAALTLSPETLWLILLPVRPRRVRSSTTSMWT